MKRLLLTLLLFTVACGPLPTDISPLPPTLDQVCLEMSQGSGGTGVVEWRSFTYEVPDKNGNPVPIGESRPYCVVRTPTPSGGYVGYIPLS